MASRQAMGADAASEAGLMSANQLQNGPLTALNSFKGRATTFGLNMDGSPDKEDNGQGAFGYNTRDPELAGASLPFKTLSSALGGDYRSNPEIRKLLQSGGVRAEVTNAGTGQTSTFPIVDAGPAAWTGNAVDLTPAAHRAIGSDGDAQVNFRLKRDDGTYLTMN